MGTRNIALSWQHKSEPQWSKKMEQTAEAMDSKEPKKEKKNRNAYPLNG